MDGATLDLILGLAVNPFSEDDGAASGAVGKDRRLAIRAAVYVVTLAGPLATDEPAPASFAPLLIGQLHEIHDGRAT